MWLLATVLRAPAFLLALVHLRARAHIWNLRNAAGQEAHAQAHPHPSSKHRACVLCEPMYVRVRVCGQCREGVQVCKRAPACVLLSYWGALRVCLCNNVFSLGLPDGWEMLAALSILAVKTVWAVFVFACGCVCVCECVRQRMPRAAQKLFCVEPVAILTLAHISYIIESCVLRAMSLAGASLRTQASFIVWPCRRLLRQ